MKRFLTRSTLIGVVMALVMSSAALGGSYPAEWDSLDVAGLTNLAKQYKDQGAEGVDNSKLLASYVAAKYATDSAADNVDWNQWLELTTILGRYFRPETQAAMAQSLQQALTPNAETTAALAADKVIAVGKCLAALAQGFTGGTVCATWITGSDKYKSVTGAQTLWLSGFLQAAGEAGDAARQRMVGHMTDTYQSDKDQMKAQHAEVWNRFASVYAKHLSAESKAQWVARLRAAYGEKNMDGYEYKYLCRALRGLGDTDVAGFSIAWMNSHENSWQSWTAKRGLAELASNLRSSAAGAATARAKVLAQVTAKYLSDDQAATRSVAPLYWRMFIKAFDGDLSPETAVGWADKLLAAFTETPETLKGLTATDVRGVAAVARDLGRWKEATAMALSWFNNTDSIVWSKANVNDLSRIAKWSVACEPNATELITQRMNTLEEQVWLPRDQQQPLTWRECLGITDVWREIGNKTKAHQWVMKAYQKTVGTEEARASANRLALLSVAEHLKINGLTGKGKGHEAYATALAGLIKNGKLRSKHPWYYYYYAAVPLGTPETRQIVQAELTDSEGQPRTSAAKVLSYAYRATGELATWQSFLDGKIAAPGITGDTKAQWLIARSFAETVRSRPPSPLRGKKWLDQALATATSAAQRFVALEQIVRGYAAIGRHDTGLQVLNSIASQFAGTNEAGSIETLREEIREAKTKYIAAQARYEAKHKRQVTKAWKAELRRRLAKAQQRGDQEEIRRLERILQQ